MDREQLLDILKHSSLDRETKLMIIDLLTLSDDPELEEEIAQLVLKWDLADKAIVMALLKKFDDLQDNFEKKKEELNKKTKKDTIELADSVSREQQIQKVRNYIETL